MKTFKLEKEPKISTGFRTPEHYFDDFSVKILAEINTDKKVKVIPFYRHKRIIPWVAAAAVIIALMIPALNKYNNSNIEIDENALESYLAYQSNLNQYDLIREMDNKDIQAINESIVLEEDVLEDILSSNPNIENLISE